MAAAAPLNTACPHQSCASRDQRGCIGVVLARDDREAARVLRQHARDLQRNACWEQHLRLAVDLRRIRVRAAEKSVHRRERGTLGGTLGVLNKCDPAETSAPPRTARCRRRGTSGSGRSCGRRPSRGTSGSAARQTSARFIAASPAALGRHLAPRALRTCSAAMSVVVLEKPHHVSSPPFT